MKFTAPKPQFEESAEPISRRVIWIAVAIGATAVLLLGLAMVAADGCRSDSAALNDLDFRGAKGLRGSDEHLVRAISLLEHIEEYQQAPAIAQVMSQLSQWIADQPPLDEWSADPLLSSLPKPYARMAELQRPAAMEFTIQDYYSLSEAVWTRNVARWQVEQRTQRRAALQQQIDDLEDQARATEGENGDAANVVKLQSKLARLKDELEPAWLADMRAKNGDVADDLAIAHQLFDWTMRNVQLEKTNWDVVLPDPDAEPPAGEKPAPLVAPPPGGELHAWQSLLLGRGDAANRGRIFLLLARQHGLDAVMLGLRSKTSDGEPRPWAAGVLLGEEIYLFDSELGLPIPGPGGEGIVTLSLLRAQPDLLQQLDLDDAKYHVTGDDLVQLVALIDATPQALSQRMLLVEKKLPREHQLVLTVEPSSLQRKLRKLGVDESQIWTAPYVAFAYDQLRQGHPEANAKLNSELAIYGGPMPIFPARMLHLRGEFVAEPPNLGAKAFYLSCRKPDREIALISTAPELRKEMIARNPELEKNPAVLDELLQQTQDAAIQAKRQASYWLGLVAYEGGDFGAAIDYLAERTLKGDPDGPWTNSARYNLARVFEATGQPDEAIALYEADDSPQRHGNQIRARRLKKVDE